MNIDLDLDQDVNQEGSLNYPIILFVNGWYWIAEESGKDEQGEKLYRINYKVTNGFENLLDAVMYSYSGMVGNKESES